MPSSPGPKLTTGFTPIFRQSLRHLAVTFGRPLLRPPTRARVEHSEIADAVPFSQSSQFRFGSTVAGKFECRILQRLSGNSLSERHILFHNMTAATR